MPQIEAELRRQGRRLTQPRRAVIAALGRLGTDAPPEAIYREARRGHPRLGRATVYRTLELLRSLGLAHAAPAAGGPQRFSLPQDGHHHHAICLHCGSVSELDDCLLGRQPSSRRLPPGFRVRGHFVEVYGLCAACA